MRSPARLLWYMRASSPGSVEPAGVIGVSYLEEVVEDAPESLHARFRHLGVWTAHQVEAASRRGIAQALRFSNTETWDRSVNATLVRELVGYIPVGPIAVSPVVFGRIYALGHFGE